MTTSLSVTPTKDLYTTMTSIRNPKVSTTTSCPTGLLQKNTLPDSAFSASSGKHLIEWDFLLSSRFANVPKLYLFSNVSELSMPGNLTYPAKFSPVGDTKYWCSQKNAQKEGEWIQVDLGSVRKIYSIGVKVHCKFTSEKQIFSQV